MGPPALLKIREEQRNLLDVISPTTQQLEEATTSTPLWPATGNGERCYLVGRGSNCNIQLTNEDFPGLISRKHASIRVKVDENDKVIVDVEDLGSMNGTYVNGIRITPRTPHTLRNLDVVTFGGRKRLESRESTQYKHNPFVYWFVENTSERCLLMQESEVEKEAKRPRLEDSVDVPSSSTDKLKDSVLGNVEENFECFICRDWIVGTTAMAPCGHIGCGGCIEQWLKRNKTCPVCRTKCTSLVHIRSIDSFLEKVLLPLLEENERKLFQERVKKLESSKEAKENARSSRNQRPSISNGNRNRSDRGTSGNTRHGQRILSNNRASNPLILPPQTPIVVEDEEENFDELYPDFAFVPRF